MSGLEQDRIGSREDGAGPAVAAAPGRELVRRYHKTYDPSELARAIQQLMGVVTTKQGSDDDEWSFDVPSPSLPSEDMARLRVLERIAADPRGHQRRSIVGSRAMVHRLEALSASMPHFAQAIDLVARAALVSMRTETPLRLPPILLLGEPGLGKSYALRRLAEAIGADFSFIAANVTDAFRLRGLNTAWRGSRMGRVAEVLLGSATSPAILVDEFDKAVGDNIQRPYDGWHSLLERENAATFRDDFLEIELQADHVLWFASANDILALPASIIDRMLIIDIPAPSPGQLAAIVASMYGRVGQRSAAHCPKSCLSRPPPS